MPSLPQLCRHRNGRSHCMLDMSQLFKGMQSKMSATLELGRAGIVHNGEMGEAAEESWRKWLRTYLPGRYEVDKAIVVDCDGNTSDQIDIVIYDRQYSYFVFKHEQVKYVPAESVYAVIESRLLSHMKVVVQIARAIKCGNGTKEQSLIYRMKRSV